jgi:ribonuclease HI
MLEIPWHIRPEHKRPDTRGRRLLIVALAATLHERGPTIAETIAEPAYTPQWRAANALAKPPQWLFDVYRRPLTCSDLSTAYDRGCILISDVVLFDARQRTMTLQPQGRGAHPTFIREIRQWIDDDSADLRGQTRLRVALNPGPSQPHPIAHRPNPPFDIPFTQSELMRVYGQDLAATDPATEWVAYTDGSVIQVDGRARGSFAGTFTQGPDTPVDFSGRVLELPLSSTRMEAMAIAVAVAITPPSVPLKIYSDSLSAVHMMRHVAAPIATRELTNSPDAFLWLHLRSWMRPRDAPVTVEWVLGHSGVAGNEKADRLAASAHNDSSATRWTTQMPPPPDAPFWMLHDRRVIPRRPRRILREQDEAITAERLVEQVNSVPNRPTQSPEQVKHILRVLQWTVFLDGEIRKQKCWKITNSHDSHIRAFGYKHLLGFLPTLARQRAWYPEVYDRPSLYKCAKCGDEWETQEHIYDCADHSAAEECFGDKYLALQPRDHTLVDMRSLQPWNSLGLLQGRVHPGWKTAIPMLRHGMRKAPTTPSLIRQLLRASLETWYHAIWLPRCQRTISQERSQGLSQGAKLRRMRATSRYRTNAPRSPTPTLPPSFLDRIKDREAFYRRFLSQLMHGTGHSVCN